MDFHDADNSVWSFLRKSKSGTSLLLFVVNATPVVRTGYRVGVPTAGFWKEILNTDSSLYGGTDVGNSGGIQADPDTPVQGRPHSLSVTLPPLSVCAFRDCSNTEN